jgi:hypothetical protein
MGSGDKETFRIRAIGRDIFLFRRWNRAVKRGGIVTKAADRGLGSGASLWSAEPYAGRR